jgi:hypothetical protein
VDLPRTEQIAHTKESILDSLDDKEMQQAIVDLKYLKKHNDKIDVIHNGEWISIDDFFDA